MYTALNLSLSLDDFQDYTDLIEFGTKRMENLKSHVRLNLKDYIISGDVIDGTELSNDWFSNIKSDIFISHSHDDTELALALAGWIEQVFELNVFLDEVVWESSDDLLHEVDVKYCKNENNDNYNYKKRNLSTAHIHAMLSVAIYSVIDKTELMIFLNTSNSIPKIDEVMNEDSTYTLSPWLYQELYATKLLRTIPWQEYRKQQFLEHSKFNEDNSSLKIAYKTPINELASIDVDALCKWKEKYEKRINEPYGGLFSQIPDHPLNYLYDIVFDIHSK